MKQLATRMSRGLFALAISLACIGTQSLRAQEASADARQEQQSKKNENEKNFGLREEAPEEKQAEVNEVTVEVARVDKTSEQLLRIVTTTGAVWDQTVGTPVLAPKPGTAVIIKRTALGGMMCKLDKWTSYRCMRVDRPAPPAPNTIAQATPTQSSPQMRAPTETAEPSSLPKAAVTSAGARQAEMSSSTTSPLAQAVPAPLSGGRKASPDVQLPSPSPATMSPPQREIDSKQTNDVSRTESVAKVEGAKSISAPLPSLSEVQQSSPVVSPPPNVAPRQESNVASLEERRKQNEQNFGLHDKTPEQRKVELDEVNVEVASTAQTSDQLLRIVTTTGAVWDQTVGGPINPPKPGTIVTIKRAALGGSMCKIGKWTTYRCLRVDRPG